MRRLEVLDGMRGYVLVLMMLNHLTFAGGYLLVKINHGELGYVQDAQGFIFLSGLLVGMVYARRMLKEGYGAGVFFFQAEDGIRDFHVTGVQTCALPI